MTMAEVVALVAIGALILPLNSITVGRVVGQTAFVRLLVALTVPPERDVNEYNTAIQPVRQDAIRSMAMAEVVR